MFRAITTADWPAIMQIQQQSYPAMLHESLAVLQSKQQLAPSSCRVFANNNGVHAYCFAHPGCAGEPAPLNETTATTLLANANTLYIHDIAVAPAARGQQLAQLALRQLVSIAEQQQLASLSLVAVNGAANYWQRLGFVPYPIAKSLRAYGESATYMVRSLSE